jgi:4-hydroxybenzoyl-CoA thioesterase
MLTNRRTVRIEWGDCDPAGIVFYPRYFAMFDHSTVLLIERALGQRKHELYELYDFDGYPVGETQARFLIPTRYGDDVEIESAFMEVRRSSFRIQHRLLKNGRLAVEGNETRVWVVRDPTRHGRYKAQPMPEHVVARFAQDAGATAPP